MGEAEAVLSAKSSKPRIVKNGWKIILARSVACGCPTAICRSAGSSFDYKSDNHHRGVNADAKRSNRQGLQDLEQPGHLVLASSSR
jgi:hypothetical protein